MSEFICIACPVGCRLTVEEKDGKILVTGNSCGRGATYGRQEFKSPVRTVTSLIAVQDGKRPLVPVKTAQPVPKESVMQVLAAIGQARVQAPVSLGQVLIGDVAGTGIEVIATRDA